MVAGITLDKLDKLDNVDGPADLASFLISTGGTININAPVYADDSIGMMAGIEVAAVGNPGARGHELQKALYDRGLNLKSTGDTLIVAPAFIAEPRHIEEITGKIREALIAAG